jgi:predicted nucleotidyltransferase
MLFLHQNEIIFFLQSKIQGLMWIGLFGSILNDGFEQTRSDIDIVFISKHEISNIKRWEVQEQLASKLNIDIDLVDLKKSDDVIAFEALSKGKEIFKNGSRELEIFLDNIYINYIQLNEDRKEIMEMYT